MDQQPQPPNGTRLDRIERALEHLVSVQASHESRLDRVETGMDRLDAGLQHLLSVQASHETRLDRIETGIQGLVDLLATLAQQADRRFRETDERLNTLIRIMDDWIRQRPTQPGQPGGSD